MNVFGKYRRRSRGACGITWTCRRCGAVFTTEAQYAMHVLMCGS